VHVRPSKGDIVTFSYDTTFKKDLPTNPEITRIRTDITWKDVLTSYINEAKHLNGM
jgi:hypothetical protein